MPGPTRKPEAIAELEGNPGKRSYAATPKPRTGAPSMPTWLSREAKAEWRRIVPELETIGLLSVVDRAALVSYCESWSTFVAASRDIAERGAVVAGRNEKGFVLMVKNPTVAMQRDALAQIRTWCQEFGLTPSARGKMSLPNESPDDKGDAEVHNLFAVPE